jgi:HPt (histidine-containing phosphotransfer) domain-containing protein
MHPNLSHDVAVSQTQADQPYHRIMRAAHVIKGAASNLMCQSLRDSATSLEKNSSNANLVPHESLTEDLKDGVQKSYDDLKEAVESYNEFLEDIGV